MSESTSAAAATADDFVVAQQAVCHDRGLPSYITLPVIPRPGAPR